MCDNYDKIRNLIERVIYRFEDFDARVRQNGGYGDDAEGLILRGPNLSSKTISQNLPDDFAQSAALCCSTK
jgi:hypothetical protein